MISIIDMLRTSPKKRKHRSDRGRFVAQLSLIEGDREEEEEPPSLETSWKTLLKPHEHRSKREHERMIEGLSSLDYFRSILQEGGFAQLSRSLVTARGMMFLQGETIGLVDEDAFDPSAEGLADWMYVIVDGQVESFVGNSASSIGTISTGGSLGGKEMVTRTKPDNLFTCRTECRVIRIFREAFDRHLKKFQQIFIDSAIDFLRQTKVFAHWETSDLSCLLVSSIEIKLRENETLYRQGDQASEFCVLKTGWLTARVEDTPIRASHNISQQQLESLKTRKFSPLDYFGHLEILHNQRRKHSVASDTDAAIIRFPSRIFIEKIIANPNTQLLLLKEKISERFTGNRQSGPKETSGYSTPLFESICLDKGVFANYLQAKGDKLQQANNERVVNNRTRMYVPIYAQKEGLLSREISLLSPQKRVNKKVLKDIVGGFINSEARDSEQTPLRRVESLPRLKIFTNDTPDVSMFKKPSVFLSPPRMAYIPGNILTRDLQMFSNENSISPVLPRRAVFETPKKSINFGRFLSPRIESNYTKSVM